MPSPTSVKPTTATSSSTPDVPSKASPSAPPRPLTLLSPERIACRERRPDVPLAAYKVIERSIVEVGGRRGSVQVFPGDYVISAGTTVVDVVTAPDFERLYETIDQAKLVIAPNDQTALETVLGFGTTQSSQRLTLAVQRLARLRVGDIDINFSPAQWEELARRAEKRGLKLAPYMQQIVDRLTQDLWTNA